jgi:hypothetical protein
MAVVVEVRGESLRGGVVLAALNSMAALPRGLLLSEMVVLSSSHFHFRKA